MKRLGPPHMNLFSYLDQGDMWMSADDWSVAVKRMLKEEAPKPKDTLNELKDAVIEDIFEKLF